MRHCSSPRWPPCSIRLVSGPPSARRVGGERSIAHRRRRDGVGVSAPERAIAVDSAAVLAITSDAIARYSGSAPVSATVQVLKDLPLRLVARYDLALADGTTALVAGKWYAIDRGAVVSSELEYLAGIGLAVAPLLGYWPAVRLLLTAWVPGRLLTHLLAERADTAIAVARAAGRWAARLHSSDMPTPRSCGPAKQRAALTNWRATSAAAADLPAGV